MDNIIVEKEIDGVIYRAQYKGIAYSIELNDRMGDSTSSLRLAETLFREILVSPRVDIDDFADIETYLKVYDFLLSVADGDCFGKIRSKTKAKQRARDNWALWRLVLESEGAISYQTVFGKSFMNPQDIVEANCALDMLNEARRRAAKRKS